MPEVRHRCQQSRWKKHLSIVVLLALAVLLLPAACIDSKCYSNRHCASGNVCEQLTGECVEPECETNSDCPSRQVCEQNACVVGCLDQEDCASGLQCVNNRCRAIDEQCQCPVAPPYCLTDINPTAPTSGQQVCVPGDTPGGTLLLFGSVFCSHCKEILAALLVRRASLRADGLNPRLVFVQVKTAAATPQDVHANLPGVTAPVIQDDKSLDIWEAYHANWYHAVILDTHACVSAHFGPLSRADVDGATGASIEQAWRRAMTPVCSEQPQTED